MKYVRFVLLIGITVALLLSCGYAQQNKNSAAGAKKEHIFRGKVEKIDMNAKTFTVNAKDNVANTSSTGVSYSVNYNFSGYLVPVYNPPTVNTGKAGKTYPVKWQLRDANGKFINAVSTVTSIASQVTSCGAFVNAPAKSLGGGATGGSSLRYDSTANQYIYNWKTTSSWAGTCRQLIIRFADGTFHRADFKFSR